MQKYILSVTVQNNAGVLARVSSLFGRRGYNIDSLTVSATTDPKISRMSIIVQGDEPMIDPEVIDRLALLLKDHPELDMATAAVPLAEEEYDDPAAVKVVVNRKGEALYFSRSLIPYPRNGFAAEPLKHVGIYAYRKDFLAAYAKMEQTPLEKTESLEQLRALEMGYKIGVIREETPGIGIYTEEDLKRAEEYFERVEKE